MQWNECESKGGFDSAMRLTGDFAEYILLASSCDRLFPLTYENIVPSLRLHVDMD